MPACRTVRQQGKDALPVPPHGGERMQRAVLMVAQADGLMPSWLDKDTRQAGFLRRTSVPRRC